MTNSDKDAALGCVMLVLMGVGVYFMFTTDLTREELVPWVLLTLAICFVGGMLSWEWGRERRETEAAERRRWGAQRHREFQAQLAARQAGRSQPGQLGLLQQYGTEADAEALLQQGVDLRGLGYRPPDDGQQS